MKNINSEFYSTIGSEVYWQLYGEMVSQLLYHLHDSLDTKMIKSLVVQLSNHTDEQLKLTIE